VDFINRNRKDHIITIEDPIRVRAPQEELPHQPARGARPHQVIQQTPLRAALREDPDIVLVGEMRDLETIGIAIETAETGTWCSARSIPPRRRPRWTASSTSSPLTAVPDQDHAGQFAQGGHLPDLCKKAKGRIAAMEVLLVNSAVSKPHPRRQDLPDPLHHADRQGAGMVILNDALFKLVTDKQVAPEEAYVKAIDKQGLLTMFKSKGISLKLSGMAAE